MTIARCARVSILAAAVTLTTIIVSPTSAAVVRLFQNFDDTAVFNPADTASGSRGDISGHDHRVYETSHQTRRIVILGRLLSADFEVVAREGK